MKQLSFLREINITYPVFSGNIRRVFKPDEPPSSPNSNSGGSLWNRKNIYVLVSDGLGTQNPGFGLWKCYR